MKDDIEDVEIGDHEDSEGLQKEDDKDLIEKNTHDEGSNVLSAPVTGFVSRSKRGGKDIDVKKGDDKSSVLEVDGEVVQVAKGFMSRSQRERLSGNIIQEKVVASGTILDRLGGYVEGDKGSLDENNADLKESDTMDVEGYEGEGSKGSEGDVETSSGLSLSERVVNSLSNEELVLDEKMLVSDEKEILGEKVGKAEEEALHTSKTDLEAKKSVDKKSRAVKEHVSKKKAVDHSKKEEVAPESSESIGDRVVKEYNELHHVEKEVAKDVHHKKDAVVAESPQLTSPTITSPAESSESIGDRVVKEYNELHHVEKEVAKDVHHKKAVVDAESSKLTSPTVTSPAESSESIGDRVTKEYNEIHHLEKEVAKDVHHKRVVVDAGSSASIAVPVLPSSSITQDNVIQSIASDIKSPISTTIDADNDPTHTEPLSAEDAGVESRDSEQPVPQVIGTKVEAFVKEGWVGAVLKKINKKSYRVALDDESELLVKTEEVRMPVHKEEKASKTPSKRGKK